MITGACLYRFNATRYLGSTYGVLHLYVTIMTQNENQILTLSHPAPYGLSTSTLHCSPSSPPSLYQANSGLPGYYSHISMAPFPPAHLCLPVGNSCSPRGHQLPSTQNPSHGERMGLLCQRLDQPLRGRECGGSLCIDKTPYSIPPNLSPQVSCQGAASLFNTFLRSLVGFL